MNKLLGSVLGMAASAWLVKPLVRRAKIRAAIYYLESVRSARQIVFAAGALVLCFVIMAGGAILIPLALCLFMPWQPLTKAIVASAFGAVYVIVPIAVAVTLMSEKRWMKLTKADKLLHNVLGSQSTKEGVV